jgi:HTH-type transcriptional regulator, transcriptional repressor of NAD biosynthesis genes
MRTGFIVGKFYPPHRGHKYLIEFARAQVDRLIVMLAHHPSQDYGPQYATLMGSEHVMVDRNRLQIPVSATQIRTKPLEHLEMLEPCVRACNVLRVVLIGAESTGKTTLAKILSSHFDTHWVAEYGREHWGRKSWLELL